MLRRRFLQTGTAVAALGPRQQQPTDVAIAGATEDKTISVGLVPSSLKDFWGRFVNPVKGLPEPRPVDADLTDKQLDAMVRKAVEFGLRGKSGLTAIVAPDDWVVVKPDISTCFGPGGRYVPGSVADLRVVRSVVAVLAENKRGARITIAEAPNECSPGAGVWDTDWGGAFGGLSYRTMVQEFSRTYTSIKFDIVDLNADTAIELPVRGKTMARRNSQQSYFIPRTIQQCDRLISVAPLKTHPRMGVSLTFGNYFGIASGAKYGLRKSGLDKLGEPDEVSADLFSFHPADYAILGGSWGLEGDRSVHHNVVIAAVNAVAADVVGAAVMGFDPGEISALEIAESNGFGSRNIVSIWIRASEIEQAKRAFQQPDGWTKARSKPGKQP